MDEGKDQVTPNKDDSNVVFLDENRNKNEIEPDGQQPFVFDGMPDNDEDTQDLLRALQQGEIPHNDIDHGDFGVEPHNEQQEIPVTASEKSAEIQEMVEAMAGETPDVPEEDEELDEDLTEESPTGQFTVEPEALPDMEIKSEMIGTEENKVLPNSTEKEVEASDSKDDSGSEADAEVKRSYELDNDQVLQQQPMVQTNLAGGLGHAFGSVINGVFSGIGMALGSGLSAVKQTKEALTVEAGDTSVSNKMEEGTFLQFNPATQAVNDSFDEDAANNWKQNRIDTEFASLQMDVEAHLRSVDKLKQTEWAQKLKAIEESGDPELMAKAPAILNIAKAKTDFKDADRDMFYFQEHIQQRAERLSDMTNNSQVGSERLENVMNKWQEDAKKRLDDLPDSKEKQGFLERIQNTAQNVMAGLRSMFSKSASMR